MTRAIVPPCDFSLLCCSSSASPPRRADTLVRIEGKNFIAPDGGTLQIKGINLGNWLMPEGYMFKFEVAKSPRQIYGAFDRLLGPERAQAFWRQFRDTYITRDDIAFIKSGRLQHRAHPPALAAVHGCRRRDHRRGLVPARPRAGLGARRRAFGHRRSARRTRRPDRHQPR